MTRPDLQQRPRRRQTILCEWCERSHKTWHALAKCRFRRGLAWVAGNPPADGPCWALVSFCRHPYPAGPAITVTLWEDHAEALQQKVIIDRTGCGGSCSKDHRLIALHDEGQHA